MNWNRVEHNWVHVRGYVKVRWSRLTDKDLDQISGRYDRLVQKLQQHYGLEREEAKRRLDDWAHYG